MSSSSTSEEKPRFDRGFSFLRNASETSRSAWLLGILLGTLYVGAIVALQSRWMLTDERYHYTEMMLLRRGDWRVLPELTTIPGYHFLVAMILRLLNATSLDAVRIINAAFGLLAAAGFHAARRRAWPGTETIATAQFIALPILAPLFFVAYTDVLALALLLWALWATFARRHLLSALLLVLLVGVRQHEVIWAACLAALACAQADVGNARDDAAARTHADTQARRRRQMAVAWPYAIPVLCFIKFWLWNGSISLSPSQAGLHPDFSVHLDNLFLAVVVAGLLLPLHAGLGFGEFIVTLRQKPWLIAVPLLAGMAFWVGFRPSHPYNTIEPFYYVHNLLPYMIARYPVGRAVASVIFAIALCGLARTRLRPQGAIALYPVATVFLVASWLIELRYELVPLALWLALREHRDGKIEYATLALWLSLAVLMVGGTATHLLFV